MAKHGSVILRHGRSYCTAASHVASLVPPEGVLVGLRQNRPPHAVAGIAQRLGVLGHLHHRLPQLHHSFSGLESGVSRGHLSQEEGSGLKV